MNRAPKPDIKLTSVCATLPATYATQVLATRVPYSRRVRRFLAVGAGLTLAMSWASLSFAQNLRLYHTTDPDVAAEKPTTDPDDPWDEVDADGEVRITLGLSETIWFAACNEFDDTRYKHLSIEIEGDVNEIWKIEHGKKDIDGFWTDDDTAPVAKEIKGFTKGVGYRSWDYRMFPQPRWERFAFRTSHLSDVDADFTITLSTLCSAYYHDYPTFGLSDASWGAPGVMIGEPRVTEIAIFPLHAPVDPDTVVELLAPPESGPWLSSIVYADAFGDERPFGGVSWTSDGAGLSPADHFDLNFALLGPELEYEVIAHDAETGQYTRMLVAPPTWSDALDAYDPGPLLGIGGWEAWDDDPIAGGFEATGDGARSAPNALAIDGSDDAVQPYAGYTFGLWTFSAWQYVPQDMDHQQAFILLNTYESGGDKNWSLQLMADGAEGLFTDFNSGDALPLVRDRWAEIRVVIDLDEDQQSAYYDGELLVTKSWTDGVTGDGARNIAALDLWGSESLHTVLYDDFSVEKVLRIGACSFAEEGCIDGLDEPGCLALGGVYEGHGSECEAQQRCPADLDGSGSVDFGDILAVLAAWGGNGPEDLDDSGTVDFGDLLVVLANWGPCV